MEKKTDREVGINYDIVKKKIIPVSKPVPQVELPDASAIEFKTGIKPLAPPQPVYQARQKPLLQALQWPEGESYELLLPDSARRNVVSRAIDRISTQKNNLDNIAIEARQKRKDLRFHQIEWHRKFSLSFACIVLFLIGAPLGSIIRKGGMGMPLVIAVIFFLIFHLLNMFGEKFVREGITSAVTGMWLSTFVLLPIGFFLTYKAMRDSQLFNKEFYYRLFKQIRTLIRKVRPAKS